MLSIRYLNSLALLLSIGISCGAIGQSDKISAEAINEYAQQCISARQRMNLIAHFGSDYRNLDLRDVNFRGLHVGGFSTILTGADFTGADLHGAQFGSARLAGASFRDTNLSGTSFVTADLTSADFTGATFGDVHFQECNFTDALLPNADLSRATINGGRFSGADLSRANLFGVKNKQTWYYMVGVNLQSADLTGVRLRRSQLVGANLTGAILQDANLTEANLTGANMEDVVMNGATVKHAIFDDVIGLDPTTLDDLRIRANRASFERKRAVEKFLRAAERPTHICIAILASIVLIISLTRSNKRICATALLITNVVATIPLGLLMYMHRMGGSSTAQLSGGSYGEQMWSTWFNLWPVAIIGSLAMIPIAATATIWMVIRLFRARGDRATWWILAGALLTGAHAVLLLRLLSTHFPDA